MTSKPSRSSMKLCIGRWKISGALDVLKNIRTQWKCPKGELNRTVSKFLGTFLSGCDFINSWQLVMLFVYAMVEVSWVSTNPCFIWFYYCQHAGYPLCWVCYRKEHFMCNQLMKCFLYGLSQDHCYSSWGLYRGRNVFVNCDGVLSWQFA